MFVLLQATSPIAYMFIALHHNVSSDLPVAPETPYLYTYGWKDLCAIFFYCLICIVMHGIIQEYVLDVSICRIVIVVLFQEGGNTECKHMVIRQLML